MTKQQGGTIKFRRISRPHGKPWLYDKKHFCLKTFLQWLFLILKVNQQKVWEERLVLCQQFFLQIQDRYVGLCSRYCSFVTYLDGCTSIVPQSFNMKVLDQLFNGSFFPPHLNLLFVIFSQYCLENWSQFLPPFICLLLFIVMILGVVQNFSRLLGKSYRVWSLEHIILQYNRSATAFFQVSKTCRVRLQQGDIFEVQKAETLVDFI